MDLKSRVLKLTLWFCLLVGGFSVVQFPGFASDEIAKPEKFVVDMQGVAAPDVANLIAEHYKVNILVASEFKEKVLFGSFSHDTLEQTLAAFAWLLNCDFVFKDDIYYFGGKSISYDVLPSAGLTDDIKGNFPDSVNSLGDKIVVKGTEKDVKNMSETIKKLTVRDSLNCWVYIFQISSLRNKEIGFNIQPQIKIKDIKFSDFAEHKVDLKSIFADSTLKVDVKNSFDIVDRNILIDTSLECLSGKESVIVQGKQQDRPIYTAVPAGGQTSSYVSGYQSYNSGITLKIKPFLMGDSWVVTSELEHSRQDSELVKTLVNLKSNVKITGSETVCLGVINLDSQIKAKTGILSGLSFFDWLTPTKDEKEVSQIYILLSVDSIR